MSAKKPCKTLMSRDFQNNDDKQGYIGDLSVLPTSQLKELLERQLRLLGNRFFIRKLKDKGDKIMKLKQSIEDEISKRNDKDHNITSMMLELKLHDDLNSLEWNGKCLTPSVAHKENSSSNSCDNEDVLTILATHSGAGFHKKIFSVEKPNVSLIKPSDTCTKNATTINEEAEGFVGEIYAKNLCKKFDSEMDKDVTSKTKFLPFKTLNISTSHKKELRKPTKGWEITAATPPNAVFGDTKMVTLQESIKLQSEQQQKLKEIQMRHAAERLVSSASQPWSSMSTAVREPGAYRDPDSSSSSDEENCEQDNEELDLEDQDSGSVVVYNLVDNISNN